MVKALEANILTHFSYTYVGLACWQQIQTRRKTITLMMYVFHFRVRTLPSLTFLLCFLKILFWLAWYFSLRSLWLTSPFNSTSLFQSKQDFQRRKEEMALAVEATRKRLEAVSTLSFLQNVGKGRKNCRIKPRDMKIERYLLAKIKLNAIEEKYYDFITLLTYVLYCNSLRPRSHVSGYF